MRRFQRLRDGVWDEERLFPPVGGLVRNSSSSFGLETPQFGRKRPFLQKLLAGKPRPGAPGARGGVQGKRLGWECFRHPPPSRGSPRGAQLQGDTPGLSPSGTRGQFSFPNPSAVLRARTLGIFGCWGESRMLLTAPPAS